MSQLSDLVGRGQALEFEGRQWHVNPLTFNDLCDLEERFGDVGSIDLTRAQTQRYLLWLVLRSGDADHKRFDDEYAVGELLSLDDAQKTAEFVAEVFRISGLTGGNKTQDSGDEKKQEPKAVRRGRRAAQSTVSSAT